MDIKQFTEGSQEVISECIKLTHQFNCKEVSLYHMMMIIWRKFESDFITKDIVTKSDYDAISNYWFDKAETNFDLDESKKFAVDQIRLSTDVLRSFKHCANLSEVIGCKIEPQLFLYGVMRFDNPVKIILNQYNIDNTTFMKLY